MQTFGDCREGHNPAACSEVVTNKERMVTIQRCKLRERLSVIDYMEGSLSLLNGKEKQNMSEYQLQIKQVVDYPRCRIYRQFVQSLITD